MTKSATDKPYLTVLGMGGYTPISSGRKLYQFDATAGQRFGPDKKFGLLFGGSYDFNARGIDDMEPAYGTPPPFVPNTEDLRLYHYDRSRYGFGGGGDYKLGDMSSVYLRGLFAKFKDYGEDWIYSPGISNFVADPSTCSPGTPATAFSGPAGCGGMGYTNVYRRPGQQIFSVQAGARHAMKSTLIAYELALSQAHYTGGYDFGGFAGPGSDNNSVAFGVDTKDPFVPKFQVLNGVNIYDPTQYHMTFADAEKDSIFERDVVGDISLNKQYSVGCHYSSFEVGFKGWDAAKTSRYDRENFNNALGLPMTEFLSS